MQTLLIIRDQDFNPDAPELDPAHFETREAARAVVQDADGKVPLLYVGVDKYHKLPGGGIDEGEDMATALQRELLEEIGCQAEVTGEVGIIVEYRNQYKLKQTSYCFVAKQIGEKGQPDFTEKEIEEQFSIVWANNLEAAIALVQQDAPENYEGKFIRQRDLTLLQAASKLLH